LIFINIFIAFIIDTFSTISKEINSENQDVTDREIQNKVYLRSEDSMLKELNQNPTQFTHIIEVVKNRTNND